MAIKFQQLTSTTGSAPLAMNNAIDAIKALALTHSSWSLVEDVTLGTNNVRWCVLKCSAGVAPTDFYTAIIFQPSNGAIKVITSEGYTLATHTMTGVVPSLPGTTTSTVISASGQPPIPTTVNQSSTGFPQYSAGTFSFFGTSGGNTITTNTVYWMAGFYDDHCFISLSNALTAPSNNVGLRVYSGSYTSTVPNAATNDPVRVIQQDWAWTSSDYLYGAATREPLQFASTTRYGAFNCPGFNYLRAMDDSEAGRNGSNRTGKDLLQDAFPASRVMLCTFSSTVAGVDSRYFGSTMSLSWRGALSNTLRCISAGAIAGIAYGDTINYNGTQWALVGAPSATYQSVFKDTGQAAA